MRCVNEHLMDCYYSSRFCIWHQRKGICQGVEVKTEWLCSSVGVDIVDICSPVIIYNCAHVDFIITSYHFTKSPCKISALKLRDWWFDFVVNAKATFTQPLVMRVQEATSNEKSMHISLYALYRVLHLKLTTNFGLYIQEPCPLN